MRQRGIIGFSGFGEDEPATVCPPGQYGVPPYCWEPSSWLPGGSEGPETCPEGLVGIPPNCAALPTDVPQLPSGQTTPPAPAPPSGQQAAIQPVAEVSWWSQRTDSEKWLLVGVGVLGAVSFLALLKGAVSYNSNGDEPAPEAPLTPNPSMTKAEAERRWRKLILPRVVAKYGVRDLPARRESWNDYTDALHKSGRITLHQYENWAHPKA